jgi:hypothetical protein
VKERFSSEGAKCERMHGEHDRGQDETEQVEAVAPRVEGLTKGDTLVNAWV